MKKSWEVIGIQWEVIRGLCKVMEGHGRSMRGSWSSVEGQGVVIGNHLEVRCSLLTLPKAMGISRSEILRKQEHKVSYRCSLPSPLQKRSKDYKLNLLGSAKVNENSEAQKLQNFNAILCNPRIFSAMAMTMSIYRTLCVLV